MLPLALQTSPDKSSSGSLFGMRRPFGAAPYSASTEHLPPPIPVPLSPTGEDQADDSSARPTTARRNNSSISSLSDLRSSIRRRSASLKSRRAPSPPSDNLANLQSPEKRSASSTTARPSLTVSTAPLRHRSDENIDRPDADGLRPSVSAVEARQHRGILKRDDNLKPPPSAPGRFEPAKESTGRSVSAGGLETRGTAAHNPRATLQHISDLASKRISTLDYLRKAHEGRVFWFNALLFEKGDLSKMQYFEAKKMSRRATNYLMLGLSIPAILDPNSGTAIEYLRAFNALLAEFESYQAIHPAEGNPTTSFSRARLPQMFKRSAQPAVPKGRRGSSTDAISPQTGNEYPDPRSASSGHSSANSSATFTSFPGNDQDLLPGEEYQFLLTPSLPFEPDYFETFATLCDILIDCYTKVMGLVNTPDTCGPGIEDLFSKADARVRKLLIAGLVRDFEDSSKTGIRTEIAGIGKLVMGGLM